LLPLQKVEQYCVELTRGKYLPTLCVKDELEEAIAYYLGASYLYEHNALEQSEN